MDQLINTVDYTIPQLVVAAMGAVFWITAYAYTIKNIIKHQFVEMPVYFACGNIVWEFLWGFIFYERINMGELYVWSYRVWFLIDIYIFWNVLKYGHKQITLEPLKRHAKLIFIALSIAFAFIIYAYIIMEFDNPMGAQTSYILNLGFSTVYILIFLRLGHKEYFSKKIAWFKMIGTFLYTIFFVMTFPENHAVTAVSFTIFFVDLVYIYIIYKYYGENHPMAKLA